MRGFAQLLAEAAGGLRGLLGGRRQVAGARRPERGLAEQAVGGFLKGKKLPLGDGVNGEDATLLDAFPYAADPKAGFDNTKGLQKP